jgi:hypothetical protein
MTVFFAFLAWTLIGPPACCLLFLVAAVCESTHQPGSRTPDWYVIGAILVGGPLVLICIGGFLYDDLRARRARRAKRAAILAQTPTP